MADTGKNLTIMSSLAVELALRTTILPQFEASTGIVPIVTWEPTTVLMRRVREGARADVILAIDESMDQLEADGLVRSDTRMPVARALLGLAVKRGAPRPDISSLEAFQKALVGARAVAYSLGGASGIYFQDLIRKLGIAEAVIAHGVTIPAGFTATKVISGEAEIAVQQISELMTVEGVDIVGPFPPEVQVYTDFSAAMFSDASNQAEAALFLAALKTEAAAKAFEQGGVVPRLPQPSPQ